jgi:hypothetical protein
MSTVVLVDAIALLAGVSATGSDTARSMKRRTPHSPPRSWLLPTAIAAPSTPKALTDSRDQQRPGPDPITPTQAATAKSP